MSKVNAFISHGKIIFGDDLEQVQDEKRKEEIRRWKENLNMFTEKIRHYVSYRLVDEGCLNEDIE